MVGPESPRLTRLLCRWTNAAQRRPSLTASAILALTIALGTFAADRIRFNFDPNSLFSPNLRFQRAIVEFEKYFPVLTNSLLIVVDAETPERMRASAEQLVTALDARKDRFHRAYLPGEDRFFERNALLYGSVEEVYDFADHMAAVQPVLAELARDPSLPTLTEALQTGLDAVGDGSVTDEGWASVLDHIRAAAEAVSQGDDTALSWERVLISGTGFEPTTRTVIIADPVLDLDRVFAAARSLDAVRETAETLGLTPDTGTRVRVTGYPALNQEEMAGLAKDTSLAGALSFVLVIAMLSFAFRSWRFVLAAALTLIAAIVWAVAFSAATVRVLNPISITFGILVIGLGIDFMIHLGMHVVDEIAGGASVERAIHGATLETGAPLVLCALTTGVGFLAFVPTEFRGVSDLGMAAAGGMVSTLILTLTLFPALIRLFNDPQSIARLARRIPTVALRIPPPRRPIAVIAAAATLGIVAFALIPQVDLDTNVISIRNQQAESVQLFKELLEKRTTTPWFLDALAPSLEAAEALAEQMRNLPTVDAVATLADFVPEAQPEKVEILSDISMMLGLPPAALRSRVDPKLQREALETLRAHLASEPLGAHHPLAGNVRALEATLAEFLAVNGSDGPPRARRLSDVLLDPIPDQIRRLQANLDVHQIARGDLPPGLVERMVSADGHARIQAYPADDLWNHQAMVEFVESIREIWPEITGLPVNLVESARATWRSLRGALLLATAAIALLIFTLWRNPRDTAIVICPLLLAVLLTMVSTVVLPISLNFGSVIVLPLLLGIGVDSGIHLVERARVIGSDAGALLDSTTARAVLFSGFTTIASFGTLTISAHVGTASLGMLLVVGMAWTLAANLVLLPSLLSLFGTGGARPAANTPGGIQRQEP